MFLGIDFGYQNTYIIEATYNEEKDFRYHSLKNREAKTVKNHVYYKDGKPIFNNLNSIENFTVNRYVPNFHRYIQMSFNSQSRLLLDDRMNKNIALSETKEILFIFKEGDKTTTMPLGRILKDFFTFLINRVIKPFNIDNKDLYVVISYPNQYNDKQCNLIRTAAIEAGFYYVKMLNEHIAGVLSSYDLDLLKVNKKRKFVTCNLDSDNIDISFIEFDNNKFKIVEREKAAENSGMDIDDEIAAIYREIFREKNYYLTSQYEQDILNMALETKKHFSKAHRNSYIKELMGIEFSMDVNTFEELICDSFYSSIEKTAGILHTKIDYNKLDGLVIGGSNSNFVTFCQKLEHIFNHHTSISENNQLVYAKGASLWALKSYTIIAENLFSTIIDDSLPKIFPRSIGLKTNIKDLEYHVNKVLIPKGSKVPYKTEKKISMKISEESTKLTFLEGEDLLAKHNRIFGEIDLRELPIKLTAQKISVEFDVTIDLNYTITLDFNINGHSASMILKYFPFSEPTKMSINNDKDKENDSKMEYKALIAQKIAKVENYYQSLYSYAIKRKFQEKYDKVIGYKSYVKSDVFDSKKLKEIYNELCQIISKN